MKRTSLDDKCSLAAFKKWQKNPNKERDITSARDGFLYKGKVATVTQHCRDYNMNPSTVNTRLSKGVTFEEAMKKIDRRKSVNKEI